MRVTLRLGGWLLAAALATTLPAALTAQQPADLGRAVSLIEAGRFDEAERLLRNVLANGSNAAAHDLLGVVLLRTGRTDEAREQLERAVAGAPGRTEPLQHLARLLLTVGEETAAIDRLRTAATLGELERDLALRLAAAESAVGNTAAAEAQLRSVIARFDSVRAMLQLARSLASRGASGEAHDLLRRAVELAPNSEEVLANYASVSLGIRAPVAAILALEPLTRMHPGRARYSYLLGVALMQIGDMGPAATSLTTAVELAPDDVLARVALGIALNNQKRFEESVPTLEEALRLDPENVQGTAALAEALAGAGRAAEAEERARRALAGDPDHAIANLVLGMIRFEQRDYEAARDFLLRAAASDPGSPKILYQLSLTYARLGDMDASRGYLERYREALDAMESQLEEIRSRLGLQQGGMQS